MATVKGLVLLSRLDYVDCNFGEDKYKSFLIKISTQDENFERRPVDSSANYPDNTILRIDEILLNEYFNNDVNEFIKLGNWNARKLMPKFFNLYIDEQMPGEFLQQYNRLRPHLIGSGSMQIHLIKQNSFNIIIDYEQPIPKSVCLSERGFISEGIEMCGGKNPEIIETECASIQPDFKCSYQININ